MRQPFVNHDTREPNKMRLCWVPSRTGHNDQGAGCKLNMTQEPRAGKTPTPGPPDRRDADTPTNRPTRKPTRQIDENLRRAYQQDMDEQIPDRLQALIEQLRQQDKPS